MGRHGRRGDGRDPRGEVPDGLGGLLPEGGPGPRGRGGFAIDRGPVTVAGFARFAEETGYRTLAERPPEAADYPDADPLLLVAGSAVFRPTPHPVPLYSAECVGQSDTTDDASSRRIFATVEEAVEAATTLRSGNT
jgi:formylglycine-generating enzyme required for sulfatase activity